LFFDANKNQLACLLAIIIIIKQNNKTKQTKQIKQNKTTCFAKLLHQVMRTLYEHLPS